MPKWIHNRAEHILAKNPSMPKSEAFAIATQQAHAVGKSPKGYGTSQGRRTAKSKYKTPKDDKKVANPGGLERAKMAATRDELVIMPKIGGSGVAGLGPSRPTVIPSYVGAPPAPSHNSSGRLHTVGAGGNWTAPEAGKLRGAPPNIFGDLPRDTAYAILGRAYMLHRRLLEQPELGEQKPQPTVAPSESKYGTPKDDKKVANPGGLESAKMAAMRDELVAMTKIGGPGEGDPIGAPQSLEQAWNERFRRHLDQKPLNEASPEFRIWQQEADNLMHSPGGPLFVGEVPPDLSSVREVDARLKALLATMPEDLNSPDAAPSINAARRYIESLGGPELNPPNPTVEPPQVEILPPPPRNNVGHTHVIGGGGSGVSSGAARAYVESIRRQEPADRSSPAYARWKQRIEEAENLLRATVGASGGASGDVASSVASPKVESPPRSWKHYAAGVAIPATIIGGAYGLYRLLKQPEPEEQEPQPTVAPPPQMQEVPPPPKPKKVVRPVSKRVPV
jgi:hypothetical protein